jgi:hypothetical protein
MEEMSFRSGAAVSAGVLAAAGIAVALAVVPGGHDAAPGAPGAPGQGAAARSVVPPSPAPATVSPSPRPSARRAAPDYGSAPAESYQPPSQVTGVTTPQASPAPTADLAVPRRRHKTGSTHEHKMGSPSPWGGAWDWYPWTPGQPSPWRWTREDREDR